MEIKLVVASETEESTFFFYNFVRVKGTVDILSADA